MTAHKMGRGIQVKRPAFVTGDPSLDSRYETKRRRHLIADIKYREGIQPSQYGEAPIVCTCGVTVLSKDWAEHTGRLAPKEEVEA